MKNKKIMNEETLPINEEKELSHSENSSSPPAAAAVFGESLNLEATDILTVKNNFAEHGNEVEEIISKKPPFIVRWGTLFFFILLIMIGMISWFIQYPDIVTAKAKLSSVNPPAQVTTKTEGKITRILIKETQEVDSGQVLGYMESIANAASVKKIATQVDSVIDLMNQKRSGEILRFFPEYESRKSLSNLGELQLPYQTFIQSFIAFRDFLNSGFYLHKKSMLLADMQNIQKLHEAASNQKNLYQQDLSLSNQTFDANQTLVDEKIISAMEYRNERSKLIQKQLSLPQINASIISNESQQNDKKKEIAELDNRFAIEQSTFLQALQTIKSEVQAWEYKYVLKAPVSGVASFTGFLQENQEIKTGGVVFSIQPSNTSYFVEMWIPQYNSGKVKQGQEVLLKFTAYPFEQYGSVIGKIAGIKNVPTDSGFLAKVTLPQGLQTNYKKSLQYRDGLIAQADIITEQMRLPERFYYNLVKQIRR